MSLGIGSRWIGRVQRSSDGAPAFDTLHVDSTMRVDTLEWYHLAGRSGTGAPRPDWLDGAWVTPRPDGLFTPPLQRAPEGGETLRRRIAWPVATGDTALDFGWSEELSVDGAPGARSREFGVVTAVDEEIAVPAGSFNTYRVELRRLAAGGAADRSRAMYTILWFAPGAGLVRAEAHADSGSVDQVWELMEAK